MWNICQPKLRFVSSGSWVVDRGPLDFKPLLDISSLVVAGL